MRPIYQHPLISGNEPGPANPSQAAGNQIVGSVIRLWHGICDHSPQGEYRGRHLPKAVNIPLGELRSSLPRRVTDRNQVLLLHCLSGTRSGIAKRQLKGMGYQKVFNLGSYGRAKSIVGSIPGN